MQQQGAGYGRIGWVIIVFLWSGGLAFGQTTVFMYQGKLTDNGNPAGGNYDLQFKLFDTATVGTGTQQGSTVTVSNVTVTGGIFTVTLDFGACASCFNGNARFLEIGVRLAGGGAFTTLIPRQLITSTPYAIKSQNATTATTADGLSMACVNCVTSSQIASVNGSVVSGMIPVASVPPTFKTKRCSRPRATSTSAATARLVEPCRRTFSMPRHSTTWMACECSSSMARSLTA